MKILITGACGHIGSYLSENVFKIKKNVILSHKQNKAMLVCPKTWCDVKFLSKNSIILVLCDYKYDFKDYIESYDDFIKKY